MNRVIKFFLRKIFGASYVHSIFNPCEARSIGVKIGDGCRLIGTSRESFSTEPYLIEIGNNVSMTSPQFVTHDGGVWIFRSLYPEIDLFGKIIIGNNVFIGLDVIILPGTVIGDNCIIAAGAVVKGKFSSNLVIGGVPAKEIGTIEVYFEKNKNKFTYIRSLSCKEKERVLNNQFK